MYKTLNLSMQNGTKKEAVIKNKKDKGYFSVCVCVFFFFFCGGGGAGALDSFSGCIPLSLRGWVHVRCVPTLAVILTDCAYAEGSKILTMANNRTRH